MTTTERAERIYEESQQFHENISAAEIRRYLARKYNLSLHQIELIIIEERRKRVTLNNKELEKYKQYSRRFYLLCKKRGWTDAEAAEAFGKYSLRWEDVVIANRG